MAYGIRDKKLGKGRGARNTYGKFGTKVPKGEFTPKGGNGGSAKGKGKGPKSGY